MTRLRYSPAERVDQVCALLSSAGITTAAIADALGIVTSSRMSLILAAAVKSGRAFFGVARVSDHANAPERVYFSTAEARDSFMVSYRAERDERRRAYWRDKERRRKVRDRSGEVAVRSAKRAETRTEREIEAAQRRAERKALALAEREIEKARARQLKEAKAAEKAREKAEAKSQRQRLRAETKAAGQLAKLKGTATPRATPARGPAHLPGPADESRAEVIRAETPPPRFAATSAPSVISSRECRPWAEAVAA